MRTTSAAVLLVFCLAGLSGLAGASPENDAPQWRRSLDTFTRLVEAVQQSLEEEKQEVVHTVDAFSRSYALLDNVRRQLMLHQLTAEDPWDFRDVARGLRQLEDAIKERTNRPEAMLGMVENYLKRLEAMKAEILVQADKGEESPDFLQALRVFMDKLEILRAQAESAREKLHDALAPARQALTKIEREKADVKERMAESWKEYYSFRYPSVIMAGNWSVIANQWRFWKAALEFQKENLSRSNAADELLPVLTRGALLCLSLLAALAVPLGRHRRRLTPPRAKRNAYAAILLACLSLWFLYVAENSPFIYFTWFQASSELLTAAALTALSQFLRMAGSFADPSPKTAPLWPLWRLLCLGFILMVLETPYLFLELLFSLAMVLTSLSLLRKRRRLAASQKLDRALTGALGYALLALTGMALAGFPQLAVLLVAALFYASLSLRFSLAAFRFVAAREVLVGDKTSLPVLTILSGVGFPILLVAFLLLFLWLAAWQLGGEYVLSALFSLEYRYESFAISLQRIVSILVGFYATKALLALTHALIRDACERRPSLTKGAAASLLAITRYFWWGGYLLFVLFFLGFSPTSLTVVAGGLSVGIGFGLQNIVNNFISGLILLFGRSVQAGDVVEVGTTLGVVKEVNIRNTEVRTYDNATLFVPNSELVSNRIVNWSQRDPTVRREIAVGVAYGSNLDLVRELLVEAALESPFVLRSPRPQPLFWDFGASSLDFRLRLWVSDIDNAASTLSEVRDAIDRLFRKHGVEIPFPQTDLRVRDLPGDGPKPDSPAANAQDAPEARASDHEFKPV